MVLFGRISNAIPNTSNSIEPPREQLEMVASAVKRQAHPIESACASIEADPNSLEPVVDKSNYSSQAIRSGVATGWHSHISPCKAGSHGIM
jgi:hypothetical protein